MLLKISHFSRAGSVAASVLLIGIFCSSASRSLAAPPMGAPGAAMPRDKQTPVHPGASAARPEHQDLEDMGEYESHGSENAVPIDEKRFQVNADNAGGPSDPQGHQQHTGHGMSGMTMMESIAGGPFKSIAAIGSGTSLMPASSPGYM